MRLVSAGMAVEGRTMPGTVPDKMLPAENSGAPGFGSNFPANPDSTRKILTMDSVKVFPDSSVKKSFVPADQDSIRIAAFAKDSSARLQNFHYVRHPSPVVTLGKKYVPGFYATPSPGMISRKVEIDSTGKYVLIKEEISGMPYKTLLRIPLDEYIDLQMAANEREDWDQATHEYERWGGD